MFKYIELFEVVTEGGARGGEAVLMLAIELQALQPYLLRALTRT
jgi:hypothetical protein